MSQSCAVVFADPTANDTPEAAQAIGNALAEALDMLPYDALRLARDANGILLDNVSSDQAAKAVSALGAINVLTGVADSTLVPEALDPVKVRQIEITPAALGVQTGYTGMETLPWSDVELVSVCLYQQTTHKVIKQKKARRGFGFGRMAAGLVGGPMGQALYAVREKLKQTTKFKHQVGRDEHYVADLHIRPGRLLRIHSNECLYNYLGERIQERAEWNFHTILSDMAALEPTVLMSPPAMEFVEGADLADSMVENLHHFEEYNRWLFLAAMAFAGGGEEPPASPPEPPRSTRDDFAFE
ncbi:MAG: hypothetical protein ACYTGH_01415 [Planctomycetota bacterium]|jgi:hypothetical protein